MGQVNLGKNSSISFLPNSRFMNELAVIMPDVADYDGPLLAQTRPD